MSNALLLEYLDQTMLEAQINSSGTTPTDEVIAKTNYLSKEVGLPPVLTYEGVILLNPAGPTTRTFSSTADDRAQEIFFYSIHRSIELELGDPLRQLIAAKKTGDDAQIELALGKTIISLERGVQRMGELYRGFNKDSFSRFRKYFQPIGFRSESKETYPGPSGASSAIFPILDTLLGVEKVLELSPNARLVRPRLPGNGYLTIVDMEEAEKLVQESSTLYAHFENDTKIITMLNTLTSLLSKFRNNHRGNVKKYLPEVFEGGSGTGGATNVPDYLGTIIGNTKARIS